MYSLLAREYGWTYRVIDRMDLDEFFEAIGSIADYRKEILPAEVTLHSLKLVLFKFMGVKEPAKLDPVKDLKKLNMPTFTFTEEQKNAWIKAGMPNPSKFFNKKRVREI